MDERTAVPREAPPSLLVWGLSSFHAALLVTGLIGGLYLAGVAGDLLAGLGTAAGSASYLYLWAITGWTNRRWLASIGPAMATGRPDHRTTATGALKWGGVAGLLFFAGLLVVGAGFIVATSGTDALPFVVLAGLVGAVLSFAVGAVIGVVFATVDLLLLRAAVRLVGADAASTGA